MINRGWNWWVVALLVLAGMAPASAQDQRGFRPLTATSTATLSATTVSSSVDPAGALQALVTNIGSVEAFVAVTGASATAATTNGMSFPAGYSTTLQLNPGNFIAAVTASSSTSLRVTFISGTAPIAWSGGSGGGGGGGTVTQGNAGSNAQAWWVLIGDTTHGPAAVKAASTAPVATDPSLVVALSPNSVNPNGQATMANSAPVVIASNQSAVPTSTASQYPSGSTPITASATGTTAATTATLAASASLKTYICGFSIRANATAAATANSTVTGTITGTLNYTQWTAPLASGIGLTEQIFTPCIPSSVVNTAVAVVSAAPGSGGVVSVTAWGYQGN